MAMQPGKPIIGQDAVIFLPRITLTHKSSQTLVSFQWYNHDIFTEVDVYLVRNDKSKTLVINNFNTDSNGQLVNSDGAEVQYNSNGQPIYPVPNGRFVAVPDTTYPVIYYFTKQAHWDPFRKKYPVFKFRIEMVGNPSVFAESNEFKIVY